MRDANPLLDLIGARARVPGACLEVEGAHVEVTFESKRTQSVMVAEDATHILLESVAVHRIHERLKPAELDELILRSNHAMAAVGLRRKQSALTAFVKLYKASLDGGEAIQAVVAVAREADRVRQLIAGRHT